MRNQRKEKAKRIVYTTMGGDLFHTGHLNLLRRAKELGDILIVGVLTDEAIRAYKGKRKPIIPFEQRREIISALRYVDKTIPQHIRDGIENLKKLDSEGIRVNVLVRGNDALLENEVAYIKSIGGEFIHLPYTKGISTTEIIERIKKLK